MIAEIQTVVPGAPFETEIVWDAGLAGTGSAVGGRALTVGRNAEWGPEQLLLLAAESCFMTTLLSLASDDGVQVLGYVSNGQLKPRPHGTPHIALVPCVVVASESDATKVAELGRRAQDESVTARLLGESLDVTMDILTVPTAEFV